MADSECSTQRDPFVRRLLFWSGVSAVVAALVCFMVSDAFHSCVTIAGGVYALFSIAAYRTFVERVLADTATRGRPVIFLFLFKLILIMAVCALLCVRFEGSVMLAFLAGALSFIPGSLALLR